MREEGIEKRRDGYSGGNGEGRLIWVIGSEAQDDISHRPHHNRVPSHGHGWERLVANIFAGIFF